jgi:hypothetical protein
MKVASLFTGARLLCQRLPPPGAYSLRKAHIFGHNAVALHSHAPHIGSDSCMAWNCRRWRPGPGPAAGIHLRMLLPPNQHYGTTCMAAPAETPNPCPFALDCMPRGHFSSLAVLYAEMWSKACLLHIDKKFQADVCTVIHRQATRSSCNVSRSAFCTQPCIHQPSAVMTDIQMLHELCASVHLIANGPCGRRE